MPEDAAKALWSNISANEKTDLMDRAISRWTGTQKTYLQKHYGALVDKL
jgi:hypothetical protein